MKIVPRSPPVSQVLHRSCIYLWLARSALGRYVLGHRWNEGPQGPSCYGCEVHCMVKRLDAVS